MFIIMSIHWKARLIFDEWKDSVYNQPDSPTMVSQGAVNKVEGSGAQGLHTKLKIGSHIKQLEAVIV